MTHVLVEKASGTQNKARLLAAFRKESSVWLNALPCAPLGLGMVDSTVHIAVDLLLGTPLGHPHTCVCGESVNQFGTHRLCYIKRGTFSRHSALNDILQRAFSKLHVLAQLEPPGMFRTAKIRKYLFLTLCMLLYVVRRNLLIHFHAFVPSSLKPLNPKLNIELN
jgi:hypothetical protein